MSLLSYNDRCVISRAGGGVNRYDEPVNEAVIYDGRCDFQPGGQTAMSVVTSDDTVYLPECVAVRPGDMVTVKPRLAEERRGVVKLANVLESELTGDVVTEIEIKQSRSV